MNAFSKKLKTLEKNKTYNLNVKLFESERKKLEYIVKTYNTTQTQFITAIINEVYEDIKENEVN